ncbi:MAG: nicotinate-nucleotide adenylyltransferase [Gammaproteobacteria bacterium]|nr:nicotinate-nucleotide adenylyltransferase [Gammaproteobacteria bacterium]
MTAIFAHKSNTTDQIPPATGILGGTFDPVHFGHLRTALDIRQGIGLHEIRLLPCHIPGHRASPFESTEHRLEMIRIAIEGEEGLLLDPRECEKNETSYTVNTLREMREELGINHSICLIMGMDSFCTLPHWHRWQEILKLCNIIVAHRPGSQFGTQVPLSSLLSRCRINHPSMLLEQPAGGIWMQHTTNIAISSTQIRQLIAQQRSVRYLLPDAVWNHIQEHQLYQFNSLK